MDKTTSVKNKKFPLLIYSRYHQVHRGLSITLILLGLVLTATAILVWLAGVQTFGEGSVGETMVRIARGKVALDPLTALARGILCNVLVCLAVWLCMAARSVTDKILAILFPISAFVAAGFEHSVANMYFIPVGLFIKAFDPAFVAKTGLDLSGLTWASFLWKNLLPVTIGNIIGGSLLVAVVYWSVYLRQPKAKPAEDQAIPAKQAFSK